MSIGSQIANIGNLDPNAEAVMKSSLKKTMWSNLKQKVIIDKKEQNVSVLEEAFEYMAKATGISDIGTLVEQFIRQEEMNVREFGKLNSLLLQAEQLQNEISDISIQMDKFRSKDEDGNNQKALIHSLEVTMSKNKELIVSNNVKYETKCSILNAAISNLEKMYFSIGCDKVAEAQTVNQKLAAKNSAPIDFDTLLTIVGFIEQRAVEILTLYSLQQDYEKQMKQHGAAEQDSTTHAAAAPFGHSASHHNVKVDVQYGKFSIIGYNKIGPKTVVNVDLDENLSDDEVAEDEILPLQVSDLVKKVKDTYNHNKMKRLAASQHDLVAYGGHHGRHQSQVHSHDGHGPSEREKEAKGVRTSVTFPAGNHDDAPSPPSTTKTRGRS
jgi:hypothetical protein